MRYTAHMYEIRIKKIKTKNNETRTRDLAQE